jgi:hypothetical protein
MIKGIGAICLAWIAMLGVFAGAVRGQAKPKAPPSSASQLPKLQPAPATNVTVDGSEAMFTVMCALYASGFEGDVRSDNWSTFRAQMRERTQGQSGPAVDAVRDFYRQHLLKDPGAMLSRYVWFGLVSGPAPKFQPVLRRDELPPEVLELEGFSEILSSYYTEQKIGFLWRQVQPVYNRDIDRLHESISQTVLVGTVYMRDLQDPSNHRTFSIIVEPLVGRITNVRNYGDHYAIILSGSDDIPTDVVRHAFLHFLIDPLPLMYPHVVVVKRPIFELAAKAPRLPKDLNEDYFSWFSECMVRAVELKLRRLSPSEKESALATNDSWGYVMVRPIFAGLTGYEKSEPSMKNYFPDLVRGIDLKAEQLRVADIVFARAGMPTESAELSKEEISRRRGAAITTIPNDSASIAELTEGERQIAEKNPRAAEASFKAVLAKYPDQIRAWYGLGLVALVDHDGVRAKEVFGRLTTGEHAATHDPMVMSWSHIYLGRVLEDEGELQKAKSEYQAALVVEGAPTQAQVAAKKGLGDLENRKPTERP